ncbi:MAG: ATP phosphoribosyltransferase [Methanomassiliicoccales archaeon]|nr:ATP phosphoribosyltransferase [Methanomassiliicoccales archaeon]MDD1756206.1 ATP phosphoribosyltransferase [Methanomassiliicoccales archaeon]
MTLRLAVPNKGRLSERSVQILKQAGLEIEDSDDRKLFANVKKRDFAVMFVRAADIVSFVSKGAVDIGITGKDLVLEAGLDVKSVYDLNFGHCRLSVAAPESSGIEDVKDIKDGSVVATSFPNLTRKYFAKAGKRIEVTTISGAAEVTPHIGVADLIVDLVSSGSTLKVNHLKEVAVIARSNAVVIVNEGSYKSKREEIDELVAAIESVENAANKKYLMADVPTKSLEAVRKYLPGIAGPTVMNIAGRDDVVAVHVVIDKDKAYDAITRLKKLGATGILIVPIDRMVP